MFYIFKKMEQDKKPVSMLFPFKESFYERFGYIKSSGLIDLKINLDSFDYINLLSKNIKGNWKEIRKTTPEVKKEIDDFKTKYISPVYNGIVLLDDYPDIVWNRRFKDYLVVLITYNNEITAYALYTKKGFADNGVIKIDEMYWKDKNSRVMLLNYFVKHKDQIKTLEIRMPYGYNFHNLVKDMNNFYKEEIYLSTMMVRIINVEDALNDVSVKENGELIIKVEDNQCDWNNNIYKLFTDNKKLKVNNMNNSENQKIDLEADIKGLTSLLYGTNSIDELIFKKWIKLLNNKKSELIENWFPETLLYNTMFF